MTLARTSHTVVCADGWPLAVELLAGPAPRAVAIAGHAMMVDRRTLDLRGAGLVTELASRGIAVVWPDLRGHGRSGPLAAEGGTWSYDDLVEKDTPALYAFARTHFPGLPLYAVGHSLFGHVALAHLARHPDAPVDGIALLGANIWLPRWEPLRARWLVKRALMEAIGLLSRAVGYFPARRLHLGVTDEAADYFAQFVGWVRSGDWTARDGFSYAAALPRVRRPVLAIAGAGDRLLGHPQSTQRFVAAIPGHEHVTVGRAPTIEAGPALAWHAPQLAIDPDHMQLVTDERCRPAWRRIGDFVLEQASRRGAQHAR